MLISNEFIINPGNIQLQQRRSSLVFVLVCVYVPIISPSKRFFHNYLLMAFARSFLFFAQGPQSVWQVNRNELEPYTETDRRKRIK